MLVSLILKISEFDYDLPTELIAQHPLPARDASRMLVLDRKSGDLKDDRFSNLPALLRGDELIVINNAAVIPARLFARRLRKNDIEESGGPPLLPARIEILLVRRLAEDSWEALVRPGRKIGTHDVLVFENSDLRAEVIARGEYGLRRLRFLDSRNIMAAIEATGSIPLPPYIRRKDEPADRQRYQTVYAKHPSAAAAPTAGLHFTPDTLTQIHARGVEICEITLEVGLGTFQPVHTEDLEEHTMHEEVYEISPLAAPAIAQARREGRPILAVGTTVVRALEHAAEHALLRGAAAHEIVSGRFSAGLFIRPGHEFRLIDQLLTNFHLPRSTLLVLVAAFTGREAILSAYHHAVEQRYRFYSYGDCMLIR
jgi:S-adenosylmethionine:tRNA ribosyltransferase-isomerase